MHLPCVIHADRPAAGACEYCAQAHCEACLTSFLGRRYCPACLARVREMAGAPPTPVPAGTPPPPPEPASPRWPGWLSALVYVGVLHLTLMASGVALKVLLTAARLLLRKPPTPRFEVLDAGGLGLGRWALLFGGWAWAVGLTVLAVTALLAWSIERRGVGALGFRWVPTFWRDMVVGLALAGTLFISAIGVGAGKGWYGLVNRLSATDGLAVFLASFAILLPLAAVEELALRGYVLHALRRSLGTPAALVLSSAAFVALHLGNPGVLQPGPLAGLLAAGLYLGSAYLITGNLWLPIFVHTGWNLMEGPVFGLPVSGQIPPVSLLQTNDHGPQTWTGGAFGPEGGLLLILLLLVHTGALWAMRPLLTSRADRHPAGPALLRPT